MGLPTDPSVVFAVPSVTVLDAIGRNAKMLFKPCAEADEVVVFCETAPAPLWIASKTARDTAGEPLVPTVPSGVRLLGVENVESAPREYATTSSSFADVVEKFPVVWVVPLWPAVAPVSYGVVVSTPM